MGSLLLLSVSRSHISRSDDCTRLWLARHSGDGPGSLLKWGGTLDLKAVPLVDDSVYLRLGIHGVDEVDTTVNEEYVLADVAPLQTGNPSTL